jgi:hypothetical protein
MDVVEFLPTPDDSSAGPPPLARPTWRRWAQRAALAGLAGVGATLVVVGTGGHSSPQQAHLPPIKPVHINKYTPWHERLITRGGGAYIF